MRFSFLYFILTVMSLGCTYAQSEDKAKVKYNYLLYLPKNYATSNKAYPVVIYLHGSSQKGNDLSKLKTYGLPQLVDKGRDFDFIIASPQCPGNKYWSTDNWFDSLYIDLKSKYKIDVDRVYLTGVSMGGYGTYIVGMDHVDKLAALVPLCGGINDSDTTRVCTLKDTPIWAFHGTADDIINIKETERVVEGLKECGGNIKFTRLENEGHGIQYLYDTNQEIYTWLLQQRRRKK